jgi:hypothetical protein
MYIYEHQMYICSPGRRRPSPLRFQGVRITKPAAGTVAQIAKPFRAWADTGDPTWVASVE